MSLDGITINALIAEQKNNIVGARINKIFQPTKSEIIINLYNGQNQDLGISIHPEYYRFGFTKYLKPNPTNAMNFCMLLRKHLTSSKITNIKTFNMDRIIWIDFEGSNELKDTINMSLVVELMGRRSNIILLNEKQYILDSLKHIVTKEREILPARFYSLPSQEKGSIEKANSFDEFYSIISQQSYDSLAEYLPNVFNGFSKSFIKNSLYELGLDDETKDVSDLRELYEYFENILSNFGTTNISCKEIEDNLVISLEPQTISINDYIDDFFHKKEENDLFVKSKNELSKEILVALKKTSKKLENINNKLKSCEGMDKYKLYGELLTANLYRFKADYAEAEIQVENYYDENKIITIPLDTSISYSKNAEKFFKKFNKLKNTLSVVTTQKRETELEIEYIESIISSVASAKTLEDIIDIHYEFTENIQMKKMNLKSYQKIDQDKNLTRSLNKIIINGYDVYIGRNNKQNDYLTLHFADKSDMWFHAQDYHGAHVILKTNGKTPDEDTLFKCAQIAKLNSKAALEKNVSVDYTYIKYVKKHPSNKTGLVNYTNNKTIIVP